MYLKQTNSKVSNITVDDIKNFLNRLFPGANFYFLPDRFYQSSEDKCDAELNLFLWAILSNRIEIAKIFWRLGKVYK